MKFKLLLLLLCISLYSCFKERGTIIEFAPDDYFEKYEYKEGDIVFQISKSKQSPLIQYATGSSWSHCGIIVFKDNSPYVLEASNRVKLTPVHEWIAKGRFHIFKTRRVFDKPIKINYASYLGKPYDLAFSFNNNKMYCSELVYDIYLKQFNTQLAKPKKIKEYNIFGLKTKMKERGMNENQLVIAPSDLL